MIPLVMLGAAAGAACRWLLDQRITAAHRTDVPLGTFVINVLGSLLLGMVLAAKAQGMVGSEWAALLGTGFCGGFTTFSTFGYEAVRLVEQRRRALAAGYALGSVAAGLAAVFAGFALVGAVWG